MILPTAPKTPVIELSASDLDHLVAAYRSVLPFGGQARHDQLQALMAEVPARMRELIVGDVSFDGSPNDVALGVVMRLRTAGAPVRGREALGYFVRRLAGRITDAETLDGLEGLFHKYALDEAVVQSPLGDAAWRGAELPTFDYEVIVGENTLQPVYFLEKALAASKAVALLIGPLGRGTGFLVADGLMMTCNHVIEKPEDLHSTLVAFNHQLGVDGNPSGDAVTTPMPAGSFYTCPKLDFTLFEVPARDVPTDADPLRFAERPAALRDRVSIIQHPGGGPKMISMRNNLVEYADPEILQYTTSTMKGSSGAPVLNEALRVVGVHNQGSDRLVEPISNFRFARNQGSAVSAILARLAAERPSLHALLIGP